MHFGNIKDCDIANGLGVRISVFVSGCTHHCKGCFQPKTWNFKYGDEWTQETEQRVLALLAPAHIRGLSLLGGEPFEPANQRVLVPFIRRVRETYPEKDVWCWSGYTLEELKTEGNRGRCEVTDEMLSLIDVLVDGEFHQAEKNLMISFRGSTNQRLINLRETLKTGKIHLLPLR